MYTTISNKYYSSLLNIKLNMNLSLTEFHKSEINSLILMTHYNNFLEKFYNHEFLFTDGSKKHNVGCTFLYRNNQIY